MGGRKGHDGRVSTRLAAAEAGYHGTSKKVSSAKVAEDRRWRLLQQHNDEFCHYWLPTASREPQPLNGKRKTPTLLNYLKETTQRFRSVNAKRLTKKRAAPQRRNHSRLPRLEASHSIALCLTFVPPPVCVMTRQRRVSKVTPFQLKTI